MLTIYKLHGQYPLQIFVPLKGVDLLYKFEIIFVFIVQFKIIRFHLVMAHN